MIEVLMYKCEICEELHTNFEDCEKCEGLGREKFIANKGKQVRYYVEMGGGWSHWIDAYVAKVTTYKHWNKYLIKAFDCGRKYEVDELFGNSEFKRKCKVLKSQ